MPTGPGDDILYAIEKGDTDDAVMTKYKINGDQLKAFKSLHYGLTNRKVAYGEINDYYPELKTYFTGPAAPVNGTPAANGSAPTPISSEAPPDIFKLAREKNKLGKELAASQGLSKSANQFGAGNINTSDADVLNKRKESISKIDEQIKAAGYDPDEVSKSIGDLPDVKGIDGAAAMKMKADNPAMFDRYKAAVQSQYEILNAVKGKDGTAAANAILNEYQAAQKAPDYMAQRTATKEAIGLVHKYVDDGDKQKQVIANIVRDKAYGYGVGLPGAEEAISNDPRSQSLNPYQVAALQFLEDTDPPTAESYNRLLSFSPDEVKDLSKNGSFARGYESKSRELENMGMNLMRNSLKEKLTTMVANKDKWREQDANTFKSLYERYQTLSDDYAKQNERYPAVAAMDADQQMQDAMGISNKSVVQKTLLGVGENVDDAVNWVGNLIQEPFRSKKESALDDLQLYGDKKLSQLSQHETEGQELFGRSFKTEFTGELKEKIDQIKNNSSLTDEEQREQITKEIIADNRKNVSFVPNDKAGKMNFTAKSVLNAVSNVASEILPQIAIGYLTAGAGNASKLKELTSLFGSTFSTAYNDYYTEAIEKNKANPSQYAIVQTTIEAASELLNNDVAQAKKILGGGMAGSILENVTQEEMSALAKTGRFAALKTALKNTGKDVFVNAAKETYEELAGQAATNVANKQLFNEDVNLTDDLLTTGVSSFIGMLPLGGFGVGAKYKEATQMQKYALYEAGMNPEKFLAQINKDLKAANITQSEADARAATIQRAAKAAQGMNAIKDNGVILSDNEKVNLLTNSMAKIEVAEKMRNATEAQKEQLKSESEAIDKETDKLLKPKKNEAKTEAQTETGEGVLKNAGPEPEAQKDEEATAGPEMHYINPEGTEYILQDDKLYYINPKGEKEAFSETAMKTKHAQNLIEEIKAANTPGTEAHSKRMEQIEIANINDVVERIDSGDMKASNIHVGDKDLIEYLIEKGVDGREASVVKSDLARLIEPLKDITDKIDPQEVKFATENPEDINSVMEGLEGAKLSLFNKNWDIVNKVKERAKELVAFYSDKGNLKENRLDSEKTFEIKKELFEKVLNDEVSYLDLSKLGLQTKKDYQSAVQEQRTAGATIPKSSGDSGVMGEGSENEEPGNDEPAETHEVSAPQQKFYESAIGGKPSITGRIPVSPIVGGTPKKLRQIIKDVSVGLKQRVIYAKPGRARAIGSYLPWFKGIKLKYVGGIDTTAHELGHAIDDHFDIYTKASNNAAALLEMEEFAKHGGSKPPANHPNPKKYIQQEGFAEWLRGYVVNPQQAIALAPHLTALYKSTVNDKFQKVIKQFSDDFRTWRGSTGRDMILSNVNFEPQKKPNVIQQLFKQEETNSDFSINYINRFAANYLNPLHAFEKGWEYAKGIRGIREVLPENNPIILSRILNGIDGKFGEVLQSGMINGRGEVLKAGGGMMLYDEKGRLIMQSGTVKNLEWLLSDLDNTDAGSLKEEMKDVVAYMIAERTEELSKKFERGHTLTGIGSDVFTDFSVAQKTINEILRWDPKKVDRIQKAAAKYREFADDIMQYAVDKGRMSQDQYDQIKAENEYYVGLQRMLQAEPGEEIIVYPRSGGKELGAKGEITYSIKGSTEEIENPYVSLLDTLYKTLRESDRNEVLQAFRKMLVSPRDMNEGPPKRIADIGVIGKKGDKESIPIFINGKPEYWIFQKDIYKGLKAFDLDPFRVWTAFTIPGKVLRFTTTHFPTFAVRNWLRDTQARMITSTTGSSLSHLIGSKEDWNALARAGGLNSGYYLKDKHHYYGLLTEAMEVMAKDKNIIVANPVMFKHLWHKYEDLLYKGETSNRVAEYRAAFKKAMDEGMDNYNASLYAAFKARDLIDFAVAGHHMQKINQVLPFTNAAVQGLRSAAVSAKENWKGFAARLLVYSIFPGVAAWFLNHHSEEDKKWYEEMPPYQRDMFWNFRIGPNKILSMPKPYELALPQAGIDRMLSYYISDNKKAFDGYAADVRKLLLPFDEGNIAGPWQAVVEGMTNYDWFRDVTVVPAKEDPLDLSLKHTEVASRLGQLLQRFSGWDARKWDHVIKRSFSYVGNAALKLSDIGSEKSRYGFDLTDTGIFKRSPAYNSNSVQEMIKFAKTWDLTHTPPYRKFNQIVGRYFTAETDEEKEAIGNELIDSASAIMAKWKEKQMDEYQEKRAAAKKAKGR